MTLAAAIVTTWLQLAACERTMAQLERLQHAKAAQVEPRVRRAYAKGVRARDVAQWCLAASTVGEDG